jgi:HEAT repeat protein
VAAAPPRTHGPSEVRLLDRLWDESVEIDLNAEKGAADKLVASARPGKQPLPELVALRDDLRGLPLRQLSECQLGGKEAKELEKLSRMVRRGQAARSRETQNDEGPGRQFAQHAGERAYFRALEAARRADSEAGVPGFEQMLQADAKPVRLYLVNLLANAGDKRATEALARLTAFDLDAEVRGAAAAALKGRPKEDARPVLLAALRYPWPPVADHAADALADLADRDAAPDLVRLLDRPDPRAPRLTGDGKWVVPQLVRVNHLRNCLLCHAPSADKADLVRAPVPTPGKPLPVVYYDRSKGPTIRANVTYLRQDFSVLQPVDNADPWPALQRFDYLICLRELGPDESRDAAGVVAAGLARGYPQRDAVLAALRGVTGKDAGGRRENWERVLARR